jgi:uncharacterized protein YdhG (YjbR/CyaY superfamily)
MEKPANVEAYLAAVPDESRATLESLRRTIKAVAPDAVELIGYGMPGYKYLGKPLVYYAAAKKHCALTACRQTRTARSLPPTTSTRGPSAFRRTRRRPKHS